MSREHIEEEKRAYREEALEKNKPNSTRKLTKQHSIHVFFGL